jgi:hypothetical protein
MSTILSAGPRTWERLLLSALKFESLWMAMRSGGEGLKMKR